MTARDAIARAIFDPGKFVGVRPVGETLTAWQARAAEAALTAAGFSIVPTGEGADARNIVEDTYSRWPNMMAALADDGMVLVPLSELSFVVEIANRNEQSDAGDRLAALLSGGA